MFRGRLVPTKKSILIEIAWKCERLQSVRILTAPFQGRSPKGEDPQCWPSLWRV